MMPTKWSKTIGISDQEADVTLDIKSNPDEVTNSATPHDPSQVSSTENSSNSPNDEEALGANQG